MQALNDFYAMLYQAMREAMPDASLSTSGAYVWRGYRIDSYKNLAINQYYCQIDPKQPKMLTFKESFKYKGIYREYFKKEVDLVEEKFFSRSCADQQNFLKGFIAKSAKASLNWQKSPKRLEQVPKEYLVGKEIFSHQLKGKYTINQVPEDFIHAFPMQDQIFKLILPGIKQACEKALSKKVELFANAHWCNWDFRGYRMKFLKSNGDKPSGPSDYVWRIYFDEPDLLTCERYKGKDYPPIPPFHINQDFLSATEPEQTKLLYQYALHSMQIR
jgi:hypothetical protein